MREAIFTEAVLAMARDRGLLVHHCPDSRRCTGQKGFPDLVIAGPGGILFAELKSEDGETSADQDLWGWTLSRGLGRLAHTILRPGDLRNGRIARELNRLRKIAG